LAIYRRWAQGEVGDVGEDPHVFSLGQQRRHQDPRVEESPLVRMVLDPDDIDSVDVGRMNERARLRQQVRFRDH
jgi:hypothetical protein